jgi:hypothetical protein
MRYDRFHEVDHDHAGISLTYVPGEFECDEDGHPYSTEQSEWCFFIISAERWTAPSAGKAEMHARSSAEPRLRRRKRKKKAANALQHLPHTRNVLRGRFPISTGFITGCHRRTSCAGALDILHPA